MSTLLKTATVNPWTEAYHSNKNSDIYLKDSHLYMVCIELLCSPLQAYSFWNNPSTLQGTEVLCGPLKGLPEKSLGQHDYRDSCHLGKNL